jgi:hypothetical protein
MLAFFQFQRASRDSGSHDCGAASEHLALAEAGAAAQTFSPGVRAGIQRVVMIETLYACRDAQSTHQTPQCRPDMVF